MARIGKTKFTAGVIRTVSGAVIALVSAVVLTIWASFFTCLGLHPESIGPTETVIPILAVGFGAAWCGYRVKRNRWWAGMLIGVCSVVFWLAAWYYLTVDLSTKLWDSQSISSITINHWITWGVAVAAGIAGGMAGGWLRKKAGIRWTAFTALILCTVPVVMLGQTIVLRGVDRPEKEIASGVTVKTWAEEPDGTTVRLFTFDFGKNPQLAMRFHKPTGSNIELASNVLSAKAINRKRKLVCVFNAGFEPELIDWSFESSCSASKSGVGRLVEGGNPVRNTAKLGNIGLKCSRTSIGWASDSKKVYLLIVRDPDGEAASIRQQKSKYRQTGGWNIARVQKFWKEKGASNAVVLDGGDSTQISYSSNTYGFKTITSGYLVSETFCYWRERPLRAFIPMLPASLSHRGAKSYRYIEARNK